jgi:hypothetical protein
MGGEATFAEPKRSGEVAPIAAVTWYALEPEGSTPKLPFEVSAALDPKAAPTAGPR